MTDTANPRLLFPLALAVACWTAGHAGEAPEGGRPISDADVTYYAGSVGEGRTVSVDDPRIGSAAEVTITGQPANTWDVAAAKVVTEPVDKGDTLLVHFFLRGRPIDGRGGGVAEFAFERRAAPFTKSVQYLAESESGDGDDSPWSEFWIAFRSKEDYAPGESHLKFQLGYLKQTVAIGGVEVWNYGPDVDPGTLPMTPRTYPGRSRDAGWRKAAAERIDELRRADASFVLKADGGRPVADQDVRVRLVKHAFDFGTAVSMERLTEEGNDGDRYREALAENFNTATVENALKWRFWDAGSFDRGRVRRGLRWLNRHDIAARGHVLVWPGKRYLPDWTIESLDRPAVLKGAIDTHIREMAGGTDGMVRDWDVLNEVFDNRDLTDAMGDEAMVGWFRTARESMPDVELYYNDYAGLVGGGFPTGHKEHFAQTLRYLIDHDAPIDGMGIQGHFGELLTPPERLLSELDRWGSFGLKILITEFDTSVPDPELQADFLEDFLTVCFSHPGVDGFMLWGFWESAHWRPESALFAADWTPTAMGKRWKELRDRWTTDVTVRTDDRGRVDFRGYRGTYEVTGAGRTERFVLE